MKGPWRCNGGYRCWFDRDGRRHRFGGPALEWDNGVKEWFWRNHFRYIQAERNEIVRRAVHSAWSGPLFTWMDFPGYQK